jgi:hypothetical protein
MADPTQISEDDILGMSDDEIANLPTNPDLVPSSSGSNPVVEEPIADEGIAVVTGADPKEAIEEAPEGIDPEDKPESDEDEDEDNFLSKSDEDIDKPSEKKKEEPAKEADPKVDAKPEDKGDKPAEAAAPEVPVDYKAAYDKLMTPFRASNKTIKLDNIDEAIVLMQRGADYTKKMQQLKPNLKLMKMLENNGLLSEEKLSHFIDLEKKDPAALNKFLKDKNIDPFDLDPDEASAYKPGNHRVSDEEMRFTGVLEDVKSTPTGRETINFIEANWDAESIKTLYREPELMKVMDEHRSDGIFDQITSEMDRRKALGQIPDNVTFLQAYKVAGDDLHNAGRLLVNGVPTLKPTEQAVPANDVQARLGNPGNTQQPTRQVFESRVSTQKAPASNDAAARAAAPTRKTEAKPTAAIFNPLAMSDEDFEKNAGNFRI